MTVGLGQGEGVGSALTPRQQAATNVEIIQPESQAKELGQVLGLIAGVVGTAYTGDPEWIKDGYTWGGIVGGAAAAAEDAKTEDELIAGLAESAGDIAGETPSDKDLKPETTTDPDKASEEEKEESGVDTGAAYKAPPIRKGMTQTAKLEEEKAERLARKDRERKEKAYSNWLA